MKGRWFARVGWVLWLGVGAGCVTIGYVKDPSPWLATAEWDRAQRIPVTLSEYSFTPQVLDLWEGQPYVLEIKNTGREKHYFTAEEFFRAIATRKAQIPAVVEVKAPYFTALELYPGQTLELFFVAVRPGTYNLLCTIPGHSQKGMTGAIKILPRPKDGGKAGT